MLYYDCRSVVIYVMSVYMCECACMGFVYFWVYAYCSYMSVCVVMSIVHIWVYVDLCVWLYVLCMLESVYICTGLCVLYIMSVYVGLCVLYIHESIYRCVVLCVHVCVCCVCTCVYCSYAWSHVYVLTSSVETRDCPDSSQMLVAKGQSRASVASLSILSNPLPLSTSLCRGLTGHAATLPPSGTSLHCAGGAWALRAGAFSSSKAAQEGSPIFRAITPIAESRVSLRLPAEMLCQNRI